MSQSLDELTLWAQNLIHIDIRSKGIDSYQKYTWWISAYNYKYMIEIFLNFTILKIDMIVSIISDENTNKMNLNQPSQRKDEITFLYRKYYKIFLIWKGVKRIFTSQTWKNK